MNRAIAVLLLASCAPSNTESAPVIAIQPGAENRICWFCVRAPRPIARRCRSALIEERCAFLTSDVKRVSVTLVLEDGGVVDLATALELTGDAGVTDTDAL